ncbi:hypothetical protein QCA50_006361 [Cerrena zonata]|uniref:Uncharacterized protein n=1 Tax=Cerrena zonata TaxID=2478898 RepID=A0AAW0GB87_9APHY
MPTINWTNTTYWKLEFLSPVASSPCTFSWTAVYIWVYQSLPHLRKTILIANIDSCPRFLTTTRLSCSLQASSFATFFYAFSSPNTLLIIFTHANVSRRNISSL